MCEKKKKRKKEKKKKKGIAYPWWQPGNKPSRSLSIRMFKRESRVRSAMSQAQTAPDPVIAMFVCRNK